MSDVIRTHKDLEVWKQAIVLVKDIYKFTEIFPSNEKFNLASQMQRAAVSIPSNISEGAARASEKEFVQFLYISLGSPAELETQVIVSKELDYCKDIDNLLTKITDIRKMILGLIKFQKNKYLHK